MDLVQTVRKEGSRGGRAEFKWEDVKADSQRENYLGHSLMAPVGRWQKGRDLNWYARGDGEDDKQAEADKLKEEKRKIKEAEEDAMLAAMGLPVPDRAAANANLEPLGENAKGPGVQGAVAQKAEEVKVKSEEVKIKSEELSPEQIARRRRSRRDAFSMTAEDVQRGEKRRHRHRHRSTSRSREHRDSDRRRRDRSRDRHGERVRDGAERHRHRSRSREHRHRERHSERERPRSHSADRYRPRRSRSPRERPERPERSERRERSERSERRD